MVVILPQFPSATRPYKRRRRTATSRSLWNPLCATATGSIPSPYLAGVSDQASIRLHTVVRWRRVVTGRFPPLGMYFQSSDILFEFLNLSGTS